MAARFHTVTSDQVRALAEGTNTAADLALLTAGEVSKCLAMLILIVRDAEAAWHPEAGAAADSWRLLARVQSKAPAALAELLRYPSVGAWATRMTTREAGPGPSVSPGQLTFIAAAAAIRGHVSCTVVLPPSAGDGTVFHLPSLGTAVLPWDSRRQETTLRHHDGVTEIAGQHGRLQLPSRLDSDALGWHGLRTVRAADRGQVLRLVVDDADPFRLPGELRPAGRLSPARREQWQRRIAGGWRVLAGGHQRTAAEVASIIRSVVPLAMRDGDMRSVTSRRVFGSFGLSLPADDVQMALTLAHEVQHAKLSALMDLVPLVTEPATGGFYAPWRPDPRPLASLLQGMYAHVEVARFWRQQRLAATGAAERWHANVEFSRWRNACAQVADSLRGRPELTGCGAVFVDGMINALRAWQNDSIPPAAAAQADRETSEHKREWDARRRAAVK
jgi:HEXXH motif-containing protein